MKTLLTNRVLTLCAYSLVLILLVASCAEEPLEDIQPKLEQGLINYNGLQVRHDLSKVPENGLYLSPDELTNLLLRKINEGGQSTFTAIQDIPLPVESEITRLADEVALDYPANVYEPTESEADQIRSQFPGMSDEAIDENLETIEAYYEAVKSYMIIESIAAMVKGGPTMGGNVEYSVGPLCNHEWDFMKKHLTRLEMAREATNHASSEAIRRYPNDNGGNGPRDAFRHAAWNLLLAKRFARRKMDIGKGIDFAKGLADAHERCNLDDGQAAIYSHMDYRNNHVGRELFRSTAYISTSGKWPFRRRTIHYYTDELYYNIIKNKVDQAAIVAQNLRAIWAIPNTRMVRFR